ncbi:MAG TPA: hypothetical protein EYP36_04155, partial [Calditrichaeota bacterium]|nr:hypothetical protein [Calditrichota bacterium]
MNCFLLQGGVSGISIKLSKKEKVTIIISHEDLASLNIKDKLQQIREWKPIKIDCEKVISAFEFKQFRLVEIAGLHIYQDRLDRQLEACGLDSDIIIFASRHRSKDERQILTVHPTGNTKEAKYGG